MGMTLIGLPVVIRFQEKYLQLTPINQITIDVFFILRFLFVAIRRYQLSSTCFNYLHDFRKDILYLILVLNGRLEFKPINNTIPFYCIGFLGGLNF